MPSASIPSIFSHPAVGEGPIPLPDAPGWELWRCRRPSTLRDWPEVALRSDDFWVSREALLYLNTHPQSVTTEGLVLRHEMDRREVLLTAQTFDFRLGKQISPSAGGRSSRFAFRRRLLGLFTARVLCIGQVLTSGDYALAPGEEDAETIAALTMAVGKALARRDCGYRAILLKDTVARPSEGIASQLANHNYTRLPIDPVMVADLEEFGEFDDYLARLTSKYRVRYRRTRSKLAGLRRVRLGVKAVKSCLPRLFELYRETSGGAEVNIVGLQPDYFIWLAGVGQLHAYYSSEGLLVGFTTAIPNGPVYQAHYLGLENSYKDSHALYHNMLFDLLRDAIEGGYASIDYGRTALEIKSSVGAEPRAFGSWLRLIPGWLNGIVPNVLPVVFESREWTPRNPYRSDI